MSLFNTIKFLTSVMKDNNNVKVEQTHLHYGDALNVPADVYQPANPKKYRGTILFIHGMNKLANRDPRMESLHRAAAKANYRVVAPYYSIVANHFVDLKSIQEFGDSVKAIAENKALCPSGKLAIFTASFSGSLCVRALTDPSVGQFVTSLCSVGTAYHPRTVFTNIMDEVTDDHYAKFISIKNFFYHTGKLDSIYEKAFSLAIDDTFEETCWQQTNEYLKTVDDEHRQTVESLIQAAESKDAMSPMFKEAIDCIYDDFKLEDLSALSCPVSLIHSETDTVLHVVESELFYKQLQKDHIPSNLVITPLLEHADFEFKLKYLIDVWRLVRGFHYFFKRV